MTARLVARSLSGGYPGIAVFSGVGFSVEPGEILTILGANGSGKSALLETLQGLLAHRGGMLLLDGESVQDLPPEVRAARGMSLVSDRRRVSYGGSTRLARARSGGLRSLHGLDAASRGSTVGPERRASAAAGTRKIRDVLSASVAAGRSSTGARRGNGWTGP